MVQVKINHSKMMWTKMNKVNLQGATFINSDLRATSLSEVNLSKSNLTQADLREAHFNKVNFYKANLSQANFSYTKLDKVSFNRAKTKGMSGSNLDFLASRVIQYETFRNFLRTLGTHQRFHLG